MDKYWNQRFVEEGAVWGYQPSISAKKASMFFKSENLRDLLVPGSGYGRHTLFFAQEGFNVEGIEISKHAIKMAENKNYNIKYYEGSVLDMPFTEEKYEAIFCFNLLHLFTEENREKFIEICRNSLINDGLAYFTVFSDKEQSYGKGEEFEINTFESKKGRPVHYFTEEDLLDHFKEFSILSHGIIEEKENHGNNGEHSHILRYICVRNTKEENR